MLALSVSVGLGDVHSLMQREVDEVVGPNHKHSPDWVAKHHGHERGSMTLGGRRVDVSGPGCARSTMRMSCGPEIRVLADRDPPTRAVMDRMLAGASTRELAVVGEPVGEHVEQESSLEWQVDDVGAVHRADPHRVVGVDRPEAG